MIKPELVTWRFLLKPLPISIPDTTTMTSTTTMTCSVTRKEDCTYSRCCKDPGMQCYEKHEYWASCQLNCTPGIDLRDPKGHHTPWTCKQLGTRTPGIPLTTTTGRSTTKAANMMERQS